MSALSEVLATLRAEDADGARMQAQTDERWLQGRSLYGGLQAALAVEAMRPLAEGLPLRTLQATLCAPVPAGPVRLRSQLVRRGKNTAHVETRIVDGEATLAIFIGIFGALRESVVQADDPRPPAMPDTLPPPMPYVEGMMPAFLQNFEAHWLAGEYPFSGKAEARRQHIRLTLRDPQPRVGVAQVIAFADFPPPVALAQMRKPTPGSTLTWMLNFVREAPADSGLEGWQVDVHMDAAAGGYTHQSLAVYAPDGGVVALSRQCMVVFG